jgi:hypothetical protein
MKCAGRGDTGRAQIRRLDLRAGAGCTRSTGAGVIVTESKTADLAHDLDRLSLKPLRGAGGVCADAGALTTLGSSSTCAVVNTQFVAISLITQDVLGRPE